jgi:DNA-directed RNA polymerase
MFDGWDRRDFAQVGDWSIEQAMALPCFRYDRSGKPHLPALSPEWMKPEMLNRILAIKRYFIGLDEQQLPDFKPIPPWTAPVRNGLHFVGTFRRDSQDAIAKAFEGEFDHARGVSALESVRYKLDRFMVDLVEQVRPVLLEREMERKKLRARDRKNRQNMLSEDISFARVIGDRPFRMRHRCDFRGRVLQVPYLHMQRDEHVKSLFQFANGKKLGSRNAGHFGGYTDHEMLEIHVANCAGQDKLPWDGRLQWVKDERSLIEETAKDDPITTLSEWQNFDKPFCFVAACRELVAARNDPHFESCLPVFFDCTASGYQHWGMLTRDENTLEKVNVPSGSKRSDLYSRVAIALELILQNATGEHAESWRKRYFGLEPKDRRALVKQPTMTFVYGVEEQGMTLQVWKEYDEIFPGKKAPSGYFGFFSRKVEEAIRTELPGAHECREYLRQLTAHTLNGGRFLQTIGPTGFPLINSYLEREEDQVYAHDGGRMRIKGRETAEVLWDVAVRSAAPNFTHSLDAAHLIRVALAARRVDIDLTANHDCFGCLAADAADMNRIIRREFILLHSVEWLALLRAQNAPDSPPPPRGNLKIEDIDPNDAEYFTS